MMDEQDPPDESAYLERLLTDEPSDVDHDDMDIDE